MKIDDFDFIEACDYTDKWTWNEIYYGYIHDIITYQEVISYATLKLGDNVDNLELIINLFLSSEDEILAALSKLKNKQDNIELIKSKWIFTIIYYFYFKQRSKIFDIIENLYIYFDYPTEISGLVRYMPTQSDKTIDENLEEYILYNKSIWNR